MTVDLEELRHVPRADVRKGGRLAARLERRDDGSIAFRYLDEYLADPAAEPIAFTLPLADEPVVTPSGSLPAFFAGLLPEGHRLTVLRRAVKTSPSDELSLLLAVGSAANHFVVSPAVAAIDLTNPAAAAGAGARFASLHQLSVGLYLAVGVGAVLLALLHAAHELREERPSGV